MNGDVEWDHSPRSSISSYTSLASSLGSSATTYTYSSAQSLPASLISQPSSYSSPIKVRPRAQRRPFFKILPLEVYDCILLQLRIIHEDPQSQSCQSCHLRDLWSLSLTSRTWDKAVVKRLLVIAALLRASYAQALTSPADTIGYISLGTT